MIGQEPKVVYLNREIVFAKCHGYRPWPGYVFKLFSAPLKDQPEVFQYIYTVKYFGGNSHSDHRENQLEPFNKKTFQKYKRKYSKSTVKEERQILQSMNVAWARYQKQQLQLSYSVLKISPKIGMVENYPEKSQSRKKSSPEQILEQLKNQQTQKQRKEERAKRMQKKLRIIHKPEFIKPKINVEQVNRQSVKKRNAKRRSGDDDFVGCVSELKRKSQKKVAKGYHREVRINGSQAIETEMQLTIMEGMLREDILTNENSRQMQSSQESSHLESVLDSEGNFNIDGRGDEFHIDQNDYMRLFKTLPLRITLIEDLSVHVLTGKANYFFYKMTKQLENEPNHFKILSMKRKQTLRAIFDCKSINLNVLIEGATISAMIRFLKAYEGCSCQRLRDCYIMERFLAAGRLRTYMRKLQKELEQFQMGEEKEVMYRDMMRQFTTYTFD